MSQTEKKLGFLIMDLWEILKWEKKIKLFALFALMFLASVAEIVSIGSLIPVITALASPDKILNNAAFIPFPDVLSSGSVSEIQIILISVFSGLIIFSTFLRLLLVILQSKLGYAIGADIAYSIFNNSLNQRYQDFVEINSSEVTVAIIQKSRAAISSTLLPLMNLVLSMLMLSLAVAVLLYVNPVLTISTFLFFAFLYLLVIAINRKKLSINSIEISQKSNLLLKIVQESMGGFRDITLGRLQPVYTSLFWRNDRDVRLAQASNHVRAESPRYVVEAAGMLFVSWAAFFFINGGQTLDELMPIFGVLILGIQRMLPMMQKGFASWTQMRGEKDSLIDVLKLLHSTSAISSSRTTGLDIQFDNKISLSDMSFSYRTEGNSQLKNVNLDIVKGDFVGIVGASGAGKSTLLDIFMGLLEPNQGEITVDGRVITQENQTSWQKHVSHVPQTIFLADASIEANIAFGVKNDEIDKDRLSLSIDRAQLTELLKDLPNGVKTTVGERGIKLSGGQLQRIGLARAFYRQSSLLVLDEATSALDSKTEAKILKAVHESPEGDTVLMVAHRISTLTRCTKVLEVKNGHVKMYRSYEDFLNSGYNLETSKK